MIQYNAFQMSKDKARLKYGRSGSDYFIYSSDVKRHWEKSYGQSKMLELVGSQSGAPYNLPDLKKWLGKLSSREEQAADMMTGFYHNLAKLISTSGEMDGLEVDVQETLFDLREMDRHIQFPCRVLDIGPGIGRHMVSLFQDKARIPRLYASVDSIGMPYAMQNLAAGLLKISGLCKSFHDLMDYEFDRKPIPDMMGLPEGSIVHMPLWQTSALPEGSFDLIIATYVLDNLSSVDFLAVCDIIRRCLRPGGVVYCRGGQERSAYKDIYLYGAGTFHGLDITSHLLNCGLVTKECSVKASAITRFMVLPQGHEPVQGEGFMATTDQELVSAMQSDYIKKEMEYLVLSKKKVLLWADQGYPHLKEFLGPYLANLSVVGITTRVAINEVKTPMGIMEYPIPTALAKKPDVVVIVSKRMNSFLREIREHCSPGEFRLMRTLLYPVAFAYRSDEKITSQEPRESVSYSQHVGDWIGSFRRFLDRS
jgi:SAM-dependent methyltransferase